MVYLWRIPENYPQILIGEYQRKVSPDRFLFKKGEMLKEPVGLPVIRFKSPLAVLREYGCLVSNAMVPIINNDCAKILSDMARADIQLIKSNIVATDGVADEYFLLNITNKVIGIDRNRSEFSYIPGTEQIMSFRKLSYIEGCLGTHRLVRDSEYHSHLLVSEDIAQRLMKEELKGIGLVQPEDVVW